MTIKFAILGAGRIGKVHARAISTCPDTQLISVSDPLPTSANEIANLYGCKVASIDEIANDSDIHAVLICTPTNTHADLIEKFANVGKAIFCEKPIDLDLQRVQACLKVVEQKNAILMVGFNRRFDSHFQSVKHTIDSGKLGSVEQVIITSRDPAPPPVDYIKISGGIFRDMTIHDFDMARFLLAEEPKYVNAMGSVLVDPTIKELGDYDSAVVTLETESGKLCIISNSRRASYGYDQRIEVHCAKGSVTAENQRPVSTEIATKDGFSRPPLHDFFMTRYEQAYADEIKSFVECVKNNAEPTPNGQDGLFALAIADAAVLSVTEQRRVSLSEII